MMKKIIKSIALVAVFIFSLVMLRTIMQYFDFKTDVGFLKFKQEVVHNKFWIFFFYVHVFSITFCLFAGLTQFSNFILTEFKNLHRIIGKLYVYNVLLINFPACLVLAFYSNGEIIGIVGFVIQDLLWGFFTLKALLEIKKGNIEKHKIFMILSYAITVTAITFRIIKNIFYNENYFSYHLFYGLTVWISLLFNLAIAYLIIKRNQKLTF